MMKMIYMMLFVSLVHRPKMIQAQCTGNGLISGCACNFIGACTWNPTTKTFNPFTGTAKDLESHVPKLTHLANPRPSIQVTEICEPGAFGIIYDCLNRIPIAATIVMTADQYGVVYTGRPKNRFKPSAKVGPNVQQNDDDYKNTLKRIPCIETLIGNKIFIESTWFLSLTGRRSTPYSDLCPSTGMPKSAIHRGHLVAALYGAPGRTVETFVYTNAVPQFGIQNSGSWRTYESKLRAWAKDNCHSAPLHVVVGAIPSTYGPNDPRFFGEAGFSSFKGPSFRFDGKQPYQVNVPACLWTAACCHSSVTRSTAFFARNEPRRKSVESVELSELFLALGAPHVDLFPTMPSCNDDRNYIAV